ncbi:hypothetical protein TRFO_06297 [Tritrichomonas foetus]|uniref:Uncharacterized protein n=1 Tax=Tritrichomonas foetus TaxID=1144522 RepID=A0A1J4K0V8_9EUKA|nr:hypothetical protein TRFO_06297 [Tritrichomonas foetus]|eukprot:OHT04416.1 hypothetical protein TRFO_06297 [Tritrichomonas foetus]
MRYDFDSLFTSMLSILFFLQRIQIDVTQYEDTDFAFFFFESILHSYVVCVEIANGNKRLILMNIKQIFNAVELMSKYSAITQRSYDLFLKLLDDLVNYCGYSFCKTLEENPIIYQVFSLIKNLPDDDLLRKSSIVEGKIALCLQKMH